jgi:IclR helix-turn-helix domain
VKQRDDHREGKFRQGELRSTAGQCSEKDADQSIVRGRRTAAAEGTHQSLERGLQVLETIATTGSLISLGEASCRTGLQRSE